MRRLYKHAPMVGNRFMETLTYIYFLFELLTVIITKRSLCRKHEWAYVDGYFVCHE